jgi:hypothetical protein
MAGPSLRLLVLLALALALALAGCSGSGSVVLGDKGGGGGGGGGGGLTPDFAPQGVLVLDGGNGGSSNSQIVTAGFFNNDANLDFATANSAGNNVSVFLGNGNGTFGAETLFNTAPTGPVSIASADLNGNGTVDLAVATQTQVSILQNDGAGAFPNRVDINVGTSNRGLALGDFDGNGLVDVAVADSGTDSLNVLLNTGNFAFNAANFPSGGALNNPRGAVSADFNQDGFPDLAFANVGGAFATIWRNSGNAGNLFPAANASQVALVAGNSQGLAAGDLTGDGRPDLAVPGINGANCAMNTFVNQAGTLVAADAEFISEDPFQAGIADFNDDGDPDVVSGSVFGLGNNGTGEVDLLPGQGDGTLAPQQRFALSAGQTVRSLAVGDFNNDGLPDVITATGGSAELMLNTSH